ncbi:ipa protein [Curvularia clavata]|uniref:Ipa protein n=1 Tax=Curvularia clavata TaxID=95742 RepID=A0A9Q9DRF8_CURCL|nr:ipa protein [Curvularia clavata]
MNETTKELHRDLARKYQQHGPRIEEMWRSLSQEQRKRIMQAGSRDGAVLKHAEDTSLENVYKFIPEWNIRDVTSPSSNFFLDMLKHRATSPLQTQYMTGFNGRPGDHAHILDMMQRKNLKLNNASEYKDCYTLFLTEDGYGESVKILAEKREEVVANMKPAMEAQLIVPQATGELILMRQMNMFQLLNIAIEDILKTASTTRTQKKRPKKPADDATAAMAQLSVHSTPKKVDLPQLVKIAQDQASSREDLINLISTEPTVLAHEVNFSFFSRPELVADEKGRMLPVHTDKYISGAVFDAVHGLVKTAAIWNYIGRLLDLLGESLDKQFKATVLKELSNTCHLEYLRAQNIFKRSVAVGMGGSKWFKRMSTNDVARLSLKRSPESLTLENPQLHYMLRLCQDETNWSAAAQWLQKLEDLHRAHPLEQDNLSEREYDSLGDLAIIVTFIQSLSSVAQLPAPNHKKSQPFVPGYAALDNELRQPKDGIDLGDYAITIDNLLEPGMAEGALTTLDQYIAEKTGTKLGFLYQDLVDGCVSSIQEQYEQQKAKASKPQAEYKTPTAPAAPTPLIEQRKQKEKTRPVQTSLYEITPQATKDDQPTQSKETFEVKPSTAAVFSSLFSRSSAARSPVRWEAFVAAMADVGFSIDPKVGSIYTFVPPENSLVQRDITLHRPHQARIKERLLLIYSRRLKKTYGWDSSMFVVM